MIEFEKYVMSLEKFKNRKPVFVFQLDENGDYDNRDVYDLHHAWTASAQRDGYKLVRDDVYTRISESNRLSRYG